MQNKTTILVVDDDSRYLQSLQRLLQIHGYSVETFSSAASLLAYNIPTGPCCAIVDVQMPDCTGLELQSFLTRARPGMPVIFITGYADIPRAVQAIKGGAADFLTKPIEEQKLLEAVRRALAQEQRLRREQRETALNMARFGTLTAREKEVCAFVVAGKLNKQIAAELGTCEKTVKVHRGRVMKKMHVESLAELVRVFVKIQSPATRQESQPAIPGSAVRRVSSLSSKRA